MRTSANLTALLTALVAARGAFLPIHKTAKAMVGKDRPFPYADLATVLEATLPALTAHGLVLLQATDAETASLITRLVHTSGEWVESVYPLPAATDPRAFGSALSYGRRYSIQALLCLTAADDDGQAAETAPTKAAPKAKALPPKPKTITVEERLKLLAVAESAGWSLAQIRDHVKAIVGVDQSKDIPATFYHQLYADFDVPPDASDRDPA